MTTLDDAKNYDLASADVSLWVFKSSVSQGVPTYTGRWVHLTDELGAELRSTVNARLSSITETLEYDILSQNNEGSALTIPVDETYAHLVLDQCANELPQRKVLRLKDIANTTFYAVKFSNASGNLFAVRKVDASWRIRKSEGIVRAVFSDQQLDIDRDPSFNISPHFDFYLFGTEILISEKSNFESVLSYRMAHVDAFQQLQTETEFAGIFLEMQAINDFVGNNKIHLRRMLAIKEKGHYKDQSFMHNLRTQHSAMSLNINFDQNGRIVPSPETCRHIFQALLDHRLDSRLSQKTYDVPNASDIT